MNDTLAPPSFATIEPRHPRGRQAYPGHSAEEAARKGAADS